MKKRMLSLLTTLALCLTLLPITALADEVTDVPYISYTWDEGSQTLTKYDGTADTATKVTASDQTWNSGWYVVNEDVTISDRVEVTGKVHLILEDGYTLTVDGGIQVAENNSLTIYGQTEGTGKLTAQNTDDYNAAIGGNGDSSGNGETAGTITIHGGTVEATGVAYSAGIGGSYLGDGGEITIYGGTVEATGVANGAGIGGGYGGDGGEITIYGGQVTAEGRNGAGIGGGDYGDGGTITIYGGTVKATSTGNGAGIGGASGKITISGGTVEATSTGYGAGIGSDWGSSSGQITITGGTVTASGSRGAGIGGGASGDGGTITIYGGTVEATSTDGGAGIGGGDYGDGGTIIITGGTVAASSSSGAGIGGGSGDGGLGGAGTFSTGTSGNAVIFASSGSGEAIQAKEEENDPWQGVFFLGDGNGKLYGASVTPVEDFTIPSGKTLLIEADKTLIIPAGVTLTVEQGGTLTNQGNIIVYGTLTGAGTINGKELPQITTQPKSTSVTEGSTADFTVEASAGEGVSLTYQWQQRADSGSSWADINGETSPSYTTEATTMAMSGWQYRCMVTGSGGSLASSAATLTVNQYIPPTPTYYTISVSADPAEGGTVSGGGSYTQGESVSLTAAPAEGWHFVAWLENDRQVSTQAAYSFSASGSRTLTARFEKDPIPVTGVTLDKTALSLTVGGSGTLTATVQPDDATNPNVTWSSDNEAVATVDENGTVTAVAAGSATITAAAADGSGVTATCAVTVTRPVQPSVDDGGDDSGYEPPSGPSSGAYQGWDRIEAGLDRLADGETFTVQMNGETTLPGDILDAIAGRDISLQVELDGAAWVINGADLPAGTGFADLDLGVETGTTGIPVDVVNALTGEMETLQLTLAHSGDFGFSLTLKLELDRALAGNWANLYYYNEGIGALEFQYAARIGGTGIATFPFDHASQYAVVIDSQSHAPEEQPEPDTLPFADVAESAWYYEAVAYVYENGLMDGTSAAAFSPGAATSRAMVATILWRMAGSPVVNYAMDFSDVGQGQWYTEAIRWAASEGIVSGYDNGQFGTNDPITREQLAAMLYRYAQNMGYDVSVGEDTNILSYTDALTVSEYAIPAMQWACGAGVITGTGDGSTLSPRGQATRAEAAAMLLRFCEIDVTR